MENEKYPYQKEWQKYLELDRVYKKIFISAPLPFLLFFLTLKINSYYTLPELIVFLPIAAFFLIIFFGKYKLANLIGWKCPRCLSDKGNTESFWFLTINVKGDCKNCGLKKWEGSNIQDKGFWSNGL